MSTVQGTLPIDDRRWFDFRLESRYASILASQAGLDVSIEPVKFPDYYKPRDVLVWSGSEENFRHCGYFDSLDAFPKRRRWCCLEGLRGPLERVGCDKFQFTVYMAVLGNTPKLLRKQSSRALECPEYRGFREQLLLATGI